MSSRTVDINAALHVKDYYQSLVSWLKTQETVYVGVESQLKGGKKALIMLSLNNFPESGVTPYVEWIDDVSREMVPVVRNSLSVMNSYVKTNVVAPNETIEDKYTESLGGGNFVHKYTPKSAYHSTNTYVAIAVFLWVVFYVTANYLDGVSTEVVFQDSFPFSHDEFAKWALPILSTEEAMKTHAKLRAGTKLRARTLAYGGRSSSRKSKGSKCSKKSKKSKKSKGSKKSKKSRKGKKSRK